MPPKTGIKRTSSYFEHDPSTNDIESRKGARPSNQSSTTVQKRVYFRVLRTLNPSSYHNTTKAFMQGVKNNKSLSTMDGGNGMHMAHGISVSEIKQTLAASVNRITHATSSAKRTKFTREHRDFVSGFISTDAEDEDEVLQKATPSLDIRKSPSVRMKSLDHTARRLNRTRANLVGGDPNVNMSIGEQRDIATDRKGRAFSYMARRVKRINAFQHSLGFDNKRYQARKNLPGKPASSTGSF